MVGIPGAKVRGRGNLLAPAIATCGLLIGSLIAIGAPIRDAGGQFSGMVGSSIESTRFAQQLTEASGGAGMLAYMVDTPGRAIANPNADVVASFADLSASPPVAALLAAHAPSGTLTYSPPGGEVLAGYATLQDLRWGVLVERPAAVALARGRGARELAFDLLLALIGAAVIAAFVSTRWLTRPLRVLADAAHRYSVEDYAAPLPTTQLSEIARLASASCRA